SICVAFQVAEWMPTWRHHNTSHVGPPGHTAKCIVDPKKVYSLDSQIDFDELICSNEAMYQ
ncbi:hypothetical protein ANCDUO_15635, partial [Ancylostoma duodenale]